MDKLSQQPTPTGETPSLRDHSSESEAQELPAWELVDSGRYRPRRIRGSLLGRELG